MQIKLITLEDGRVFPELDGKPLSWNIGSHNTFADEQAGYPKTRTVIRAMLAHHPEMVERERRSLVRGQFDRVFGGNARRLLTVIEEEIAGVTNAV